MSARVFGQLWTAVRSAAFLTAGFVVAGALFPAASAAQTRGHVTVHVARDTSPVAGALVRVATVSTRTDERGDATLTLPAATAAVVVTKIGFRPDSVFVDGGSGADTSFIVHLVEEPTTVTPVIVTAYYASTRSREVSTETGRVREAPFIPRQDAGLDAAIDDDESGAYAALEVFYTGRQSLEDDPYATVSSPYTTVGVLLSDRWKAATVFLNLENLTNVRLTNYEPLLRPRVGDGGAWTVEPWAPLQGRRINVGVRWSWP